MAIRGKEVTHKSGPFVDMRDMRIIEGIMGVLICCHTVVFLRGIHEIARRTMAKLPWLRLTALPDGAEIALLGIRNMWIWTYRIPGHLTMRCLPRVTLGWCDM